MPVKTTYPNLFTGTGRVPSDLGYMIETHQGYCVVGSTPNFLYPFLDVDSPNPSAPVNLILTGSTPAPRQILSIRGTVFGNTINLVSAGLLKAGFSLTSDATQAANNNMAAVTRSGVTGLDIIATNIPVNTTLHNGGSANTMLGPTSFIALNQQVSLFGATNATNTATGVNMSTTGRPAVVAITITSLVRRPSVLTLADFPELPKNVRELLTVAQ